MTTQKKTRLICALLVASLFFTNPASALSFKQLFSVFEKNKHEKVLSKTTPVTGVISKKFMYCTSAVVGCIAVITGILYWYFVKKQKRLNRLLVRACKKDLQAKDKQEKEKKVKAQQARVRNLIRKGANVNATVNGVWTPLGQACAKDNLEIVQILVANGADVNKPCNSRSPLYWATSVGTDGNEDLVKFLVQNGAKITSEIVSPTRDVTKNEKIKQYLQEEFEKQKKELEKQKQ